MAIRHREVAVAVVFDPGSDTFLLRNNLRWQGYAFPMKHLEPATNANAGDVAIRSVGDDDGGLDVSNATATVLDHVVAPLRSDAAKEVTIYEYQVYSVDLNAPLPSNLHPDWKRFTYDELQNAVNVTSSTREIARSFVEDRNVAVAVVTRLAAAGRQFLVVNNRNHGYFFPSTRIKTDGSPAEAAIDAARLDLGYEGPLEVVEDAPEVPDVKQSLRFGTGDRRFHYHIRLLEIPGVDLNTTGNELEAGMNRMASVAGSNPNPYWRWCTEDQLRNDPHASPSMPTVIATVLQLAGLHYGR